MIRVPTEWLPLFLIFAMCQGTQGTKPEMLPASSEIYINDGESLDLTCTSTEKIQFYYPTDVADTIATSPVELEEQDFGNKQRVVLRRPNAVYGDTGWYGCADRDVNIIPGNYQDADVNWIYVYVKSNSSYFVQNDNFQSFREVLGRTATIPCRPTSPDYKVKLSANDDTEIEMDGKASYDPRIGFTLKNITLKDSGYFRCSIENDDTTQEINYHLHVMRNQVLNEPKIIKDTLRHVTRGQTLYVNCTTDVDADIPYVFNWTTPVRSSRIMTRQYTNTMAVNKYTATSELIINGVIAEDEGNYECIITTFSDSKKATTFITVYDPDIKYINLASDDNERFYQKKYGDQIQWVVYVDAYPQATLKWLSPKGGEIVGSWMEPERSKYAIKTSSSSTILRINRLDLYDMGLYTLQATNEYNIKILNFTLEIIAKPILILEQLEAFYMPQQKVKIPCNVAAFPAPNISWSFLKAPNYPSLEGQRFVSLKNSSMIQNVTTAFLSVVFMTIDVSGNLTCTACNTLGCDSATERIFVSDVPSGFGVIESSKDLTEGDNVNVTCAASIYNYTSVDWLSKDNNPLQETEQVTIIKGLTQFTYRSELHIKNVQKFNNGSHYVCSAIDEDGSMERLEYKLIIYDPVAPYFLETNMNKTVITLELSTEGHKTVVFKCYIGGVPSPNVTWYKDDTRIRTNEQYMFLHGNQELHIKYLLDENSGRYTCKAENRFGKEMNYQTLEIKGKEISKSLIISIVVLGVICIILVIYFGIKMNREKVMRKQLMEAGLTHFEDGALECLNPELTVDDQAELLPYDKKWEFPRERLKFGKQLGFGAFGVVMKAEAQGIRDDEAVTTVAVKMVRGTTEATYIRALASELKIMVHLGKHLNVVNLLGACTKNITKRELLVIVEYCRFGNLHNYLFRHRADFINQIDPTSGKLDPKIGFDILTRTKSVNQEGSNNSLSMNSCNSNLEPELVSYTAGTDPQSISMSPDGYILSNNSTQPGWRSNYSGDYKDQNLKPICTQDLLSWAFQVARGMEYLSQRKVLHGDLAARNILLAENNIVKICDFGLAKTMYKDDNYKKKGNAPLPIKWMAIESIRDRIFSTQSDIWSFGIVLWEFFTLAKTPYPGMEAEKQYQRLIEGYRMEKPEYATNAVYDIMLQCWKAKPTLRPTFTYLVASIGDLLEESVKEHYVDLNAPYLDMNTMILESGKNDYLTMMSAPDHDALSSPVHDYVNSPCLSPGGAQEDSYLRMSPSRDGSESGIFSAGVISHNGKFEFPINATKANINSDSDSEAVELSPMLNQEEDNYLKPINVRERRAEFVKQKQSLKNAKAEKANDSVSSYCNTPQNLRLIDLTGADVNESKMEKVKETEENNSAKDTNDYVSSIIRTQDNYVNMPRKKKDLRTDGPASFSNPSYIMASNYKLKQTEK